MMDVVFEMVLPGAAIVGALLAVAIVVDWFIGKME